MIRYLLTTLACAGFGWVIYRTVGWHFSEPTISELKRRAWSDLTPKYRYRFAAAAWHRVRLRRERSRRAA